MWDKLPPHLKINEQRYLISKRRLAISHRFCQASGVDPNLNQITDIANEKVLSKITLAYRYLISTARENFEYIHRTLLDKSYIFILTDLKARIIDIFSAPEVIRICSEKGIVPGASMTEESCGTNAVALALQHAEPMIIKGEQHFCNLFKKWYCIAMPIFSAYSEPVACVDLSCSHEASLNEKFPLVKLIAEKLTVRYIEFCKNIEGIKPHISISNHQHSILSLLCEGLTCKQIASTLNISPRTVENHLKDLKKKFEAKTATQLATIYKCRICKDKEFIL